MISGRDGTEAVTLHAEGERRGQKAGPAESTGAVAPGAFCKDWKGQPGPRKCTLVKELTASPALIVERSLRMRKGKGVTWGSTGWSPFHASC
jgi:hypothetical protein